MTGVLSVGGRIPKDKEMVADGKECGRPWHRWESFRRWLSRLSCILQRQLLLLSQESLNQMSHRGH